MSDARDRLKKIHHSNDPEELLDGRKKPKNWEQMTKYEQLDHIASRILAEDRHGITSHTAMKESGILSVSQYERRLAKEVYSTEKSLGGLDNQDVPVSSGVFGRKYSSSSKDRKKKRDNDS